MARMVPELSEQQLLTLDSRAEARFYKACRDQLPSDVLVLHSIAWIYRDGAGRLQEGESDFTLLFPRAGILAVEIKGGGVALDAGLGQWHSIDREGRRNPIKDPFRQATRERYAMLDQLKGSSIWRQWPGRRLSLGHAVFLPDVREAAPLVGPDRPAEILGVWVDLTNLAAWADRAMAFWRKDGEDPLGSKGVALAEQVLCASVEVKPFRGPALQEIEERRIRLTQDQAKILRIIGGRRRAVITGGAGTGKTLIAVEKATQLARQGLKTLLLCYNRPLADALAHALMAISGLEVMAFHQLCERRADEASRLTQRDLRVEAKDAFPGEGMDAYFNLQMPFALALSNEILTSKYQAVVVDEAQDFSDEFWFAIADLLEDQKEGHLFLFLDPNQGIYRRHANLPVPDEPFLLTTNCRNTAPIHNVGYRFFKGEPVDQPELDGPAVSFQTEARDQAQAECVLQSVQRFLTEDGIPPEDIAVLVAKRPKDAQCDLLKGRRLPGSVSWAFGTHGKPRTVLVDTVARFKGLEAQAVVLWLGEEVVDEQQWETLYVGTTRAKTLLTVVGSAASLDWPKALLGTLSALL